MHPSKHRVINPSRILFDGVNEILEKFIILHLPLPLWQIAVHVIPGHEIVLIIDAVLFWFFQQPGFFPHTFDRLLDQIFTDGHSDRVSWKVRFENFTGDTIANIGIKLTWIDFNLGTSVILYEKAFFLARYAASMLSPYFSLISLVLKPAGTWIHCLLISWVSVGSIIPSLRL